MKAYLNDNEVKNNLIAQLQAHYDADEIVKGKYWEGGKGCAVGCTLHNSNHAEYEPRFGIPEMLARLEDTIFEGLPDDKAKGWPVIFIKAAMKDNESIESRMQRLKPVGYQFLYWNLTENLMLKDSDNAGVQKVIIQCREAIKQCTDAICPLTKGEPFDESAARSAESAARSAAESAAESAARSARSAVWSAESAVWSAESAARSAVWSARSAAWSAARSAVWSAESAARSAWSAAWSARSATYEKMADELIELLKKAA